MDLLFGRDFAQPYTAGQSAGNISGIFLQIDVEITIYVSVCFRGLDSF